MKFNARKFDELTGTQVYEILKSRSQIFMLEQGITCLDMDVKDYESFHFFYEQDKRVLSDFMKKWTLTPFRMSI